MKRFAFAKPEAFQQGNVQTGQHDPGLGFFTTQGHRFAANSLRDCEDVSFVARSEGSHAAFGVLDGHGGAQCARSVAHQLEKILREDRKPSAAVGARLNSKFAMHLLGPVVSLTFAPGALRAGVDAQRITVC
jgi:hypothetical protein